MANINIPKKYQLNKNLENRRQISAQLYNIYLDNINIIDLCHYFIYRLNQLGLRENIVNPYMLNWYYLDDDTIKIIKNTYNKNLINKDKLYKDIFDKQYMFNEFDSDEFNKRCDLW